MGHDRGPAPAPERARVLEQDPGSPSRAHPQREEELPSSAAEAESRPPERPATTETPAGEAQEPRQPSTPAGPPRRHSSELLLTSARPPRDPPLLPRQAPRKQQQELRRLSTQLQSSVRPPAPQQLQEPPRRSIPKTVKPAVPQRERRTQTQTPTQNLPLNLPSRIRQ